MLDSMDNREANHPSDQLARVREQIKKLQAEEAELKRAVAGLPEDDRVGRWYEAKVRTDRSRRLDTAAMKDALGEEYLAQWMVENERSVIVTTALE
jgi:hypothetical protein